MYLGKKPVENTTPGFLSTEIWLISTFENKYFVHYYGYFLIHALLLTFINDSTTELITRMMAEALAPPPSGEGLLHLYCYSRQTLKLTWVETLYGIKFKIDKYFLAEFLWKIILGTISIITC